MAGHEGPKHPRNEQSEHRKHAFKLPNMGAEHMFFHIPLHILCRMNAKTTIDCLTVKSRQSEPFRRFA